MTASNQRVAGSFRDPSGFAFTRDGVIYRQVNRRYQADFDCLIGSGLYQRLVDERLLVRHSETTIAPEEPATAYKIIKPEPISFISYPYEWCFSQLKDAALLTSRIQQCALEHEMSLKDASAFNIQFQDGRPVFIDSLSFECYRKDEPWVAYRQFCQHLLAPLALMSKTDIRLNQLFRTNIDGVPLDLASALLPFLSRLRPGLVIHLYLHSRMQQRATRGGKNTSDKVRLSKRSFLGLLDNLRSIIEGINWEPASTLWADYYSQTNYSDTAMAHKAELVGQWLRELRPRTVWDLGANTGYFSRIVNQKTGASVIAFDLDPNAVETNYRQVVAEQETKILPLVLDLTNPSPAIGWHHRERMSLLERGPADAVLALALVHHLVIGNNLSFDSVAEFFKQAGRWLVIEFVPKRDSQTQRLLRNREDIFEDYDQAVFEQAFAKYYRVDRREQIRDTQRFLYLMERKRDGN